MKHAAVILLLICATTIATAQPQPSDAPLLLGGGVGALFSWHEGTVSIGDGRYDCCSFGAGNGTGFMAQAGVLLRLAPALRLRVGLGWEAAPADFDEVRLSYPVLGTGNVPELADLDERLEASVSMATVDARVLVELAGTGLYLGAGPALHLPLAKEYTHSETIAGPSGVRYIDGSVSKELRRGEFDEMSTFLSLRLGAGALVSAGERFVVNPDLFYSIPLSDLRSESEWSVSGFSLSVNVFVAL